MPREWTQMRGMDHGKGMKDCPMMKNKMDMGPDSGTADSKPAKIKLQKLFHQHNSKINQKTEN